MLKIRLTSSFERWFPRDSLRRFVVKEIAQISVSCAKILAYVAVVCLALHLFQVIFTPVTAMEGVLKKGISEPARYFTTIFIGFALLALTAFVIGCIFGICHIVYYYDFIDSAFSLPVYFLTRLAAIFAVVSHSCLTVYVFRSPLKFLSHDREDLFLFLLWFYGILIQVVAAIFFYWVVRFSLFCRNSCREKYGKHLQEAESYTFRSE